jgi:hypothetical protein
MPGFNSQDYGVVFNGLAALGVAPDELSPGILDQLRDLAGPRLKHFNAQEVKEGGRAGRRDRKVFDTRGLSSGRGIHLGAHPPSLPPSSRT